jgi:hypothetical protein
MKRAKDLKMMLIKLFECRVQAGLRKEGQDDTDGLG